MLNDEITKLEQQCASMMMLLSEMREQLQDAKKAWPEFQVRVGAEWHSRDTVPPNGLIWASNGTRVWLIYGRGEPIGKDATAVKFWTDAYIPAPPEFIAAS
jgi:hypothetical protein